MSTRVIVRAELNPAERSALLIFAGFRGAVASLQSWVGDPGYEAPCSTQSQGRGSWIYCVAPES